MNEINALRGAREGKLNQVKNNNKKKLGAFALCWKNASPKHLKCTSQVMWKQGVTFKRRMHTKKGLCLTVG